MRPLTVRAHAKVNLALEIFSRRSDGYHDVITILHEVALHDSLSFVRTSRRKPLSVTTDHPRLPVDGDNLVGQAAHALWQALPAALRPAGPPWAGLQVQIAKKIPVGAGLGGGSADAAAALRALPRLWDLELPPAVVLEAAAAVGADVPFFLYGGTALATGTGTRLQSLTMPPSFSLPLLLVLPPQGLDTGAVYRQYDRLSGAGDHGEGPQGRLANLLRGLWEGNRERVAKGLHNGLEKAAGVLCEDLMPLKRALLAAGVPGAAMTGSGSTLFAIPYDWGQAAAAVAAARCCQPAVRVVLTHSARRSPEARGASGRLS